MPNLYPASPLKLQRLKTGIPLTHMAKALGYSISMLSLVERRLIDKPEVAAAMRRYLSAQKAS